MDLLKEIYAAERTLQDVVKRTPLSFSQYLSDQFLTQVWLKREDLQPVRSYKIRGAYCKMASLSTADHARGVVCASAGNHAQGVAFSCDRLQLKATLFMPLSTPQQKIDKVNSFGGSWVEVKLVGETFDEAYAAADQFCRDHNSIFVHPFNDEKVIAGQGTVGLEMIQQQEAPFDYLFVPIGGGGLASGVSTIVKHLSPHTKIIGVEPAGAASMKTALANGAVTTLPAIDKFVDGAAVQRVGDRPFEICKANLSDVIAVPEGKVCQAIMQLYADEALVVEPAGALTVAALSYYQEEIKGKRVGCVISGGNNDISRMAEITERAMRYEKRKHYFMINFPQYSGALKNFLTKVLTLKDELTYFQFRQKSKSGKGVAVVGITLNKESSFEAMEARLKTNHFDYFHLNDDRALLKSLIDF